MKIVYAYVVADLLHIGHLRHLRSARELGDFLIVGVLGTAACLEKKPNPIIPYNQRIEMVKGFRCVDSAVFQKEYSPLENVKKYKPDILVESTSHDEMPANDYVRSYGGRVVVLPYLKGISTTKIKERIIERIIHANKKNKLF